MILLFLSFCQLKQVVWCLCAVGMLLRAGWSFIVLGQVFHCCRVSRAMLVALVVGAGWACFRFILTLVGRCAHIQKSPQVHFSDHCGLCVGGLPGRWRQALRPVQASLYACKLVRLQRQPPSRVAQYVVDAGLGDAAVALVGGPAPHVAGLQIVIVGLYPEVGHGRAPVEHTSVRCSALPPGAPPRPETVALAKW